MTSTRPPERLARALLATVALSGAYSGVSQPADTEGFRFSGVQRTRYEDLTNQFRARLDPNDRALALQTSVFLDWRLPKLQVFAEIMDARAALNDTGSFLSTAGVNTLEPVQTYLAWQREGADGGESTLRVGRMTLDLGKRRFVSRSRYRNTVDSFAGVDWAWRGRSGNAAHAFYFDPIEALPRDRDSLLHDDFELDHGARSDAFFGGQYETRARANGDRVEAYVFEHRVRPRDDPAAAIDHATFGARAYRPTRPGRFGYEVEAALQRGHSGGTVGGIARSDLAHRAGYLHADVSYGFDARWSPTLLLQYDRATGDDDPDDAVNGRLDALFGDRAFEFGPTGIWGIIARGNLRSPGLRLTLRPNERLRTVVIRRRVELDEARDGWPGSGLADPSGASGRSVGRYLEANFGWEAIEDRLDIDGGIARMSAGTFHRSVAGSAFNGNPTYFFVSATTRF